MNLIRMLGTYRRRLYSRFLTNYRKRQNTLLEKGLFGYMFNSSGYVLVIVLLVTSLLVSISTEFLITAQTNINYIKKFSDKLKAYTIAKIGMNLSQFILEADKRGMASGLMAQRASKEIDCYEDLWAMDFPEFPIEYGSVKIVISDENSKINLSVLANEVVDRTAYYNLVQRFFLNMGLLMDFADSILDWVDIDETRSPYGAESDYYQNLESPYKSKNREMDSIDELLLVKGITPEIFYGLGGGNSGKEANLVDHNRGTKSLSSALLGDLDPQNAKKLLEEKQSSTRDLSIKIGREKSRRLSDYLRVYGDRTDYLSDLNKININTASFRVLSTLTESMTDDIVTEIIRRRIEKPFESIDEVKDLIKDENVLKNLLTVKSYIFKIEVTGKVNDTTTSITGYYYRDERKFLYWSEN